MNSTSNRAHDINRIATRQTLYLLILSASAMIVPAKALADQCPSQSEQIEVLIETTTLYRSPEFQNYRVHWRLKADSDETAITYRGRDWDFYLERRDDYLWQIRDRDSMRCMHIHPHILWGPYPTWSDCSDSDDRQAFYFEQAGDDAVYIRSASADYHGYYLSRSEEGLFHKTPSDPHFAHYIALEHLVRWHIDKNDEGRQGRRQARCVDSGYYWEDDEGCFEGVCTGNYWYDGSAPKNSEGETCHVVTGNLSVVDTNLTNIDNLDNIIDVEGNLHILRNRNLVSLNGLSNLGRVGGILNVVDLESLTNLDGLENLVIVGGNFSLLRNGVLPHVDGLRNLTEVGGNFNIFDNSSLTSLAGLSSLSTIGGRFQVVRNGTIDPSTCPVEGVDAQITDYCMDISGPTTEPPGDLGERASIGEGGSDRVNRFVNEVFGSELEYCSLNWDASLADSGDLVTVEGNRSTIVSCGSFGATLNGPSTITVVTTAELDYGGLFHDYSPAETRHLQGWDGYSWQSGSLVDNEVGPAVPVAQPDGSQLYYYRLVFDADIPLHPTEFRFFVRALVSESYSTFFYIS